jgi:hypothetical protein
VHKLVNSLLCQVIIDRSVCVQADGNVRVEHAQKRGCISLVPPFHIAMVFSGSQEKSFQQQ